MSSHQSIMENWRLFLDKKGPSKKSIINERSGSPVDQQNQEEKALSVTVDVRLCKDSDECPTGFRCDRPDEKYWGKCMPGSDIPGMNDFAWTQVFLDKVMSESEGYQNFAQKWNDVSNDIMLGLLPHMPRNMSWRELGKTAFDLALIFCGWKLLKAGGKGMLAAGRKLLDKMGSVGNMLRELGKKGWALMNSTQVGKTVVEFVKFVTTNQTVRNVILSIGLGLLGGKIGMNFVEKYSEVMNREVASAAQLEVLDDQGAILEAEVDIIDRNGLLRCDDGMLIDPSIEGAACTDGSTPSRQSSGGRPSGQLPSKPSQTIHPDMILCNVPDKYAYSGLSTYLIDKYENPDGCPEPGSDQEEKLFLDYVYDVMGKKMFRGFLGDKVLKAYEKSRGIRESRNVHPVASRQWWYDA